MNYEDVRTEVELMVNDRIADGADTSDLEAVLKLFADAEADNGNQEETGETADDAPYSYAEAAVESEAEVVADDSNSA